MMRAVVDTNILIRALIKPYGTVGPVIAHLRDGDYVIVYSWPLLIELTTKLALPRIRVKYRVQTEQVEALVSAIVLRGERVIPTRQIKLCRDPHDDMFIEAAVAGQAPAWSLPKVIGMGLGKRSKSGIPREAARSSA